jgi:O-antigen/teichoic acid export membrane protein
MTNYGVRLIAESRTDREQRSRNFWNAFAMNSIFGFLSLATFLVFIPFGHTENRTIWLCWTLWLIGSIFDVSWLFFGVQEFRMPTIRNFITKVASILTILLFVRSPDDVWVYVLATSGAILLNAVWLWPFVQRYVDWHRPTWHGMTQHIKPNLLLFIPVAATSLYTILDKILLGSLANLYQTGLYDYSEKITKIPLSVVTALGIVMLPKMSSLLSSGRVGAGKRLVGISMWAMLGVATAMMFGIAAITPEFVPVFLGTGFEDAKIVIYVLAPIIPLISATNVLGIQYLLPRHHDRAFTFTLMAGAAINIPANILLIPHFGALGTAIATVSTELAVLVAQCLVVRRELPLHSYLKGAIPFIAIGTAMFGVVRGVAFLAVGRVGNIGALAFEIVSGAVFFGIMSILWLSLTKNQYFFATFPRFAQFINKGRK